MSNKALLYVFHRYYMPESQQMHLSKRYKADAIRCMAIFLWFIVYVKIHMYVKKGRRPFMVFVIKDPLILFINTLGMTETA